MIYQSANIISGHLTCEITVPLVLISIDTKKNSWTKITNIMSASWQRRWPSLYGLGMLIPFINSNTQSRDKNYE